MSYTCYTIAFGLLLLARNVLLLDIHVFIMHILCFLNSAIVNITLVPGGSYHVREDTGAVEVCANLFRAGFCDSFDVEVLLSISAGSSGLLFMIIVMSLPSFQ